MNLSKDMGDPASPNFERTVVWGHTFNFFPNIINHYWECDDPLEKEVEIPEIDQWSLSSSEDTLEPGRPDTTFVLLYPHQIFDSSQNRYVQLVTNH